MRGTGGQASAQALQAWRQWVQQWHRTKEPYAQRMAVACERIARQAFAMQRADFALSQVMYQARRQRLLRMQATFLHAALERILMDQRAVENVARRLLPD